MYVIIQYLNSFLACSIRNLTLASLSFYLQLTFSPFLQVPVVLTVDILARNIVYTITHYDEGLQSPQILE